MLAHSVRILVAGLAGLRLGPLLERLAREGWASYRVASGADARIVLRTLQFDLVLATESLCDATGHATGHGTGYDLAQEVGRRAASLFVEIGLSRGYVWLPVLEHGTRTMGQGALDLADLEWEVRRILSGAARLDPIGKFAQKAARALAFAANGKAGA